MQNSETTKGIVFDLDYTLVHPTVKFDVVFEKFFSIPHNKVSEKWLGTIYNNPLATGFEVIQHTFPDIDTSEAQAKAESFGLEWAKVHSIYPGCVDFLQALKSDPQYKLGLLTNGPSDFQRTIIDFLDLTKYFDVIVVSGDEDVGVRKPDPEVFKIMAEKMALQPESLFMVGDAKEKEILPALELGWGGLWVTPSVNISKNVPHISWQDLLANSYTIPAESLSISWSDIYVEPKLGGDTDSSNE